jgi:hypothetical protein
MSSQKLWLLARFIVVFGRGDRLIKIPSAVVISLVPSWTGSWISLTLTDRRISVPACAAAWEYFD